ncbi:hypothetical protein ACOTEN_30150 [Achromobacter xylosoxidans]
MTNQFVVGQYAEGQGGIYIGLTAQGRHLFAAATPLDGSFEFGSYGDELEGYSDLDGAENTRKLLERGDHPAAVAASEYTADGHQDFYLPAHRELLQVAAAEGFDVTVSDVWTSTPYGSFYAWAVFFEYGYVHILVPPLRVPSSSRPQHHRLINSSLCPGLPGLAASKADALCRVRSS